MLISDKTGEIGFINLANLAKLPLLPEETKEHQPEFVEDGVYKTLYGHQESCLGMQLSDCGTQIASADTLKKVNVASFPNVFNLQSVFLEHTKALVSFVLAG